MTYANQDDDNVVHEGTTCVACLLLLLMSVCVSTLTATHHRFLLFQLSIRVYNAKSLLWKRVVDQASLQGGTHQGMWWLLLCATCQEP